MTTNDLDRWFSGVLSPERFEGPDPSLNGIQVDNDGSDVRRVAFAVDACLETVERAIQAGAGLLFVHHGLFWGRSLALRGRHYRIVKRMLEGNLALYASHLPLDAHAECGNNAGIAERLGLEGLEPFGEWHGATIGFRGRFPEPLSLDALLGRLFPDGKKPLHVLPFGPDKIRTLAVVSGGGADETEQAIRLGLDCYVTGEIGHQQYHAALESGITVIAGGHYQTETVGPRLIAERLARETGIETLFIDVPTGL